jgi:hypothetical protein
MFGTASEFCRYVWCHYMSEYSVCQIEFSTVKKRKLYALADRLKEQESEVIDCCVDFVVAESKGNGHGRVRALMSRRLKHCALSCVSQTKLLGCILQRLQSGEFSEQFKDQLRLAMHLDLKQTSAACVRAASSELAHVRRYAAWGDTAIHHRMTPGA